MTAHLLAAFLAATAVAVPWTPADALLDGRCGTEEYADAASVDLGADQRLLFRRDARRLWLCVPLRPDSLGTMDLLVVTPREPAPVRLHVSAQAGESTLRDGAWPEQAWWNQRGWAAPWVALSGFEGGKPRFAPSAAREVALDLARFGEGVWRVRLELRHARDAGGASVSTVFPAGTSGVDPAGWAALDTGSSGRPPAAAPGVGFRRLVVTDRARASEVPVDFWYPSQEDRVARPVSAADLTSGTCGGAVSAEAVEAAASELRKWGGATVGADALARWLAEPLDGVSCGAPLPAASVPWVVLASPLPGWGHATLGPSLARSGVALAHVRTTASRDLGAVAAELPRSLPFLDPDRVGVAGFGGASPAALLFAMGRAGVAGLASVDGAELWRSPASRLERHPDYDPSRLSMPFLRVVAAGRADEDRRVDAAATRLEGEEIRVDGLSPSAYFAPLALSSAARVFPGAVVGAPRTASALVDGRVTAFFAACFGESSASSDALPPGARRVPIRALADPAVRHDGRLDEPLWTRAEPHAFARHGSVRLASDQHYLYVAVDRGSPGRFSTEVVVGPETEARPSWSARDWWLHASQSVCESRGAYGDFEGCGRAVAWTVTRSQADPYGRAAEYAVSWRKLGLDGPAARVRIGVRLVDEAGAAAWPEGLDPAVPATWADVPLTPPAVP